jgi:hypothetical protein
VPDYLDFIPEGLRKRIARLASDTIKFANKQGKGEWGTTPFNDGFRVNVGWTEIITVHDDTIALVVVAEDDLQLGSSREVRISRRTGKGSRGFYRSIPGSVRVELPLRSVSQLEKHLTQLEPRLREAVRLAARWSSSPSVKKGHRQALTEAIARAAGTRLPDAGHEAAMPTVSKNLALMEGALERVIGMRYKRRRELRADCIAHHGTNCKVCDFSFAQQFGPIGKGFIHVHHLTPIASRKRARLVDAKRDLIPVCPNCHAMLHSAGPPRTVDELKELIRRNGKRRGLRR